MGSFVPLYIIDDDAGMLESTQFLLQSLDIRSTTYSDPLTFLQQARTLAPGCVLTDLRMPSMSGIELRAALAAKDIDWPVILMSGHVDGDEPPDSSGMFDFIAKPFTGRQLLAVLKRAFAAVQARRA